MLSDLPLIYWDSCVPLSYINGEPERVPHIEALLRQSGTDFQLITLVLSITEVAFAKTEQDGKTLDEATEQKIASLWVVGSPIVMVEFYELIGREAQQLMRAAIKKGWSLKPLDAIHLAAADRLKVTEFHTYDEKLDKYQELTRTKFKICRPIADRPLLIPLTVPQEQHATTEANEAEPATTEAADAVQGSSSGPTEGKAASEGAEEGG